MATVGVLFVDFPDNITAPAIGEANFRRYCLPLYNRLADMPLIGTCRFVHMDGDLKPLWGAISDCRCAGWILLAAPDNDTRPADAVRLWPEMRLY